MKTTQLLEESTISALNNQTMSLSNTKLYHPNVHNFSYHLKATAHYLICVIEGDLQFSFVKSLTDTLDALSITSMTLIETDFKSYAWVKFPKPVCFKTNKLLLSLIKKLKEFKLKEKFENETALWFYSNNDGNEILNATNYPQQLSQFLSDEKAANKKLSSDGYYTMLVEVGCGELENLDLAKDNNLKYLGLDFSASRISNAKEKIKRNKLENTRVSCLNIIAIGKEDIEELLPKNEQPLLIFPFNVFGNIAPISLLLSKLKLYGLDAAISIYKTDDSTNEMREEYYRKCGYNIEREENDFGTVFYSAEGLYTVAYSKDYLVDIMSAMGFMVSVVETGLYGYIIHIKNNG